MGPDSESTLALIAIFLLFAALGAWLSLGGP